MPELRILLRYVALLHHQRDGLTVLFPSSGHDLYLEHADQRRRLPNGNIELLREGKPFRGPAVTPESADVLIHLDRVAGRKVEIRPDILTTAPHPELNGLLRVSGGSIKALDPHTSPEFKGSRWDVGGSYKPTLTDTLEYSFSLDDAARWQLSIPGMDPLDIRDGLSLTLANEDRPSSGAGVFGETIVLDELRVLYDLTADPAKATWPVPRLSEPPPSPNPAPAADRAATGVRANVRGPSRPMCVPAQSGG